MSNQIMTRTSAQTIAVVARTRRAPVLGGSVHTA